ncbi:MAG: class I SAM-dependent methyltransferase [archaeon]
MINKIKKIVRIILNKNIIDFVGYEYFIDLMKKNNISKLEGNFCEIGVFCGGGTYKLAKFSKKFNKKVYACDIFNYDFDKSKNNTNKAMNKLYQHILNGKNQELIFKKTIYPFKENVIIKKGDSKNIKISDKLCFSFIDGYHSYDYVISDFKKVFNKTVIGGLIGFHDYGFDLPEVTKGINKIIGEYKDKIEIIDLNSKKHTLFLRRIK